MSERLDEDGVEAMKDGIKVGELAERTRVSVRTLHYYEEIGLLLPAERTTSGHRIYGAEEVARLQQICSLIHLGYSLAEIKECLELPKYSALHVIGRHIAELDQSIREQRRLRRRLGSIAQRLRGAEAVSVNEFLKAVEEIQMLEKHYTPEQLEELEQRGKDLGPEGMAKAQQDWAELIADAEKAMDSKVDPMAESVLEIAAKWRALVNAFTGGNAAMEQSLGNLYREDLETVRKHHGDGVPSAELFAYMAPALQAVGDK